MNYYQIAPPPELEPYVRYFWVFDSSEEDGSVKTYKIVADGAPGLVLQFSRSFYDVNDNRFPFFFLYGQSTRNDYNTSVGNFRNIGVVLQPDAVKSVFGIDSIDITNKYVDADLLQRDRVSELLLNSADNDHCIQLLCEYLLRRIRSNPYKSSRAAAYASVQLLMDPGTNLLKLLQEELNLSERSLERLFRANIGMSPKLFARVCRFQASLTSLRNNGYDKLSDISYGYGYADQSHFIREFREFAGVTPNAWLKRATEVVENYPEWKI
ncbi:AraC family transcriptional regulator [Pseudoflavitalea rhizosphaerae]|uniref:AraC family transcriptional regulator n=1 Tax=Pseudoflavitalea rhizosphaerae TaxID=1884793 RepID=UPI000F8E9176|nr:helix-turn-helix domain-containing protein [Pseudoflavitalea rhizosphaerae]